MDDSKKLTQLDNGQIVRNLYDEKNNAQRMMIVGADLPNFKVEVDPSLVSDAIEEGLKRFNPPENVRIERVEVPVIVKEVQRVEVPVIVKETEIELIEVPTIIIQKETLVQKIEVPVIVKETVIERVEVPVIVKEIVTQAISTKETVYLRLVSLGLFITLLTLLLSRH